MSKKEPSILELIASTIDNYDKTAENYKTDPFEYFDFFQQLHDAEPYKEFQVLVVGCGPAQDAAVLKKLGFSVVGIDKSPGMVAKAKELYPDIEVREMDMGDAGSEFEEESFDLIVAHYSLFHQLKEKLPATIKGLTKILKPEGYIYITTQESMTGTPMETRARRWDDKNEVYINAETADSLTTLFTKSDVNIFYVNRRVPTSEEYKFFKLTMIGQRNKVSPE